MKINITPSVVPNIKRTYTFKVSRIVQQHSTSIRHTYSFKKKVDNERVSWHSNRCTFWNTKRCKVRSKIWWFTEFCNSHYLSQFTVFFIDVRAKRSIVKSYIDLKGFTFLKLELNKWWWEGGVNPTWPLKNQVKFSQVIQCQGTDKEAYIWRADY